MNPNKVKSVTVPMPARVVKPSMWWQWALFAALIWAWVCLTVAVLATAFLAATGDGAWFGALVSGALPLAGVIWLPREWRLQRGVNRLARASEAQRARVLSQLREGA